MLDSDPPGQVLLRSIAHSPEVTKDETLARDLANQTEYSIEGKSQWSAGLEDAQTHFHYGRISETEPVKAG